MPKLTKAPLNRRTFGVVTGVEIAPDAPTLLLLYEAAVTYRFPSESSPRPDGEVTPPASMAAASFAFRPELSSGMRTIPLACATSTDPEGSTAIPVTGAFRLLVTVVCPPQ